MDLMNIDIDIACNDFFQRLKDGESQRLRLDWNLQSPLAKVNYGIHKDAIKETLSIR